MNALLYRWRHLIGPPRVDISLLLALLALIGAGLAVLHSAAAGDMRVVWSQAVRTGAGLAALLVLARVPPARLRLWAPWIYLATLVLLLLVPVFGTGRSGRHWLYLGFFYIQPAELMKISVPLMVAAFLNERVLPPGWGVLLACAAIIGVPTALIAVQPDLGTAMLVCASGVFVVFFAGMAWWRIGLLAGLATLAAPIGWNFLHDYQRRRLLTFMNPEADPLGDGWNIIQSKIAVGSGGTWGKGWGQGTQSRLEFLPEHTTDFIFAVLAEDFGFVGVCAMLALYLFIIGRSLWIAANARDSFGRVLGSALACTLFVYVLVNGGMITGLLPVVGVPMPLISYGGTSAVTLLAGFGIIMSLHAHRKFRG
ncbi:rod shape-determining protein RodA [Denitratimonas sp. CY0512]|uniref:rod shape-determining protein RodA n=1 Tax=Denitratimonas sp. CY0512 TaxID=3131940 RepID=UPI00309D80BC